MHDRNTGEQDFGAAKSLEAEHWPGDAFDGPVALLDEVVHVLRLAHLDGQAAIGLHAHDRRGVRAALVTRLSPLGFEHIDMLGRYAFTLPDAVARGELRPLRNPAAQGADTDETALT